MMRTSKFLIAIAVVRTARSDLKVGERVRVALVVLRVMVEERDQIAHAGEADPVRLRVFRRVDEGEDRSEIGARWRRELQLCAVVDERPGSGRDWGRRAVEAHAL